MGDRSYRGRPISVQFESTPGIYLAYFSDEYDGAPDSDHPIGMGNDEEQAVADLIEQDAEQREAM